MSDPILTKAAIVGNSGLVEAIYMVLRTGDLEQPLKIEGKTLVYLMSETENNEVAPGWSYHGGLFIAPDDYWTDDELKELDNSTVYKAGSFIPPDDDPDDFGGVEPPEMVVGSVILDSDEDLEEEKDSKPKQTTRKKK